MAGLICMCVCMYVCAYVCMYVCVRARARVCVCVCVMYVCPQIKNYWRLPVLKAVSQPVYHILNSPPFLHI
jgi:hypothetical protein